MTDYLQADDIDFDLTCTACAGRCELVEIEDCASKDKGPHPHFACPQCTPKGMGFCLLARVVPSGEA